MTSHKEGRIKAFQDSRVKRLEYECVSKRGGGSNIVHFVVTSLKNGPLPAMKSSMIVVEWKVGSPYGFDMGMAVVVVCMAGPPIENAAKNFSQTFYWLNYWHILTSKGTSYFTSNTLLIRNQY